MFFGVCDNLVDVFGLVTTPENDRMASQMEHHLIFNRRYIDSNGWFFIVMLVFLGCNFSLSEGKS